MSVADPIELRARGRKVTGWTSVRVDASLEDACRTFAVGLSGYFAATGEDQLVVGDPAELRIGDDVVVTGYVEQASDSSDGESESVSLAGRSRTCDIVDSSAVLGTWSKLTLAALFDRLRGDVDGALVDQVDVAGQSIARHRTEPGATIFDALEQHARDLGVLLTDDAQGRLVLTRAGKGGKASSPIVRGAGVLSSTGGWSLAERFSRYVVSGQSVGDADVEVDGTGAVDDPGVARVRRLIVVPERPVTKAAALRRARWEAATRAGKSFEATYTLRGWRHEIDRGALWAPNQLVEVVDGRRGVFGEELLVTRVALSLDEGGRRAEVTVQPRQGFELLPVDPPAVGVGRWFTTEAARELGARLR